METKDKTLLILAAGMGSRFGGLKQIEPMDKNGNFIIDYSIYDAVQAGFNKVVFVIKEENLEIFKNTVGNRVSNSIEVDYAFQGMTDYVPAVPADRTKPWGTAHAVLCAKDKVQGNFTIINADDFYGKEAFETAAQFMDNTPNTSTYGLIGYQVGNTLTENGAVKRGICEVEDGKLSGMVESSVERIGEHIVASPLSGEPPFEVSADHPVSMNMICFHSDFFNYLEQGFANFLDKNKDDLSKCECLIQDVMFDQIAEGQATTEVIPVECCWLGVTHRSDKPKVVESLAELVKQGQYPEDMGLTTACDQTCVN